MILKLNKLPNKLDGFEFAEGNKHRRSNKLINRNINKWLREPKS